MKYNLLISSIIFLFSCQESIDPQPADPIIFLSPNNNSITIGEQKEISLQIQNFSKSIFGISLQIDYDNSVVTFNDAVDMVVGDFFDLNAISFVRNNDSRIHLSFTQIQGQNEVNGSGVLCKLTFKGNSAGVSTIQLLQSKLFFYDVAGNKIDISNLKYDDATINVQ